MSLEKKKLDIEIGLATTTMNYTHMERQMRQN